MADVTESVAQDLVAESLLGDGTNLGSVSELFERAEAENTPDENGLYADDYPPGYQPEAESQEIEAQEQEREPSAEEAMEELHYELRDEQAQRLADEQLQNMPGTTADALIEEYELAGDPEQQEEIASGFAEVFGGTAEEINAPALESLTARTGLDIALYYREAAGNPERARPLSVEALAQIGNNFSAGLMQTFNLDTRLAQADPQTSAYLGDWVVNKAWAIVDAYQKNGHVYDMAQVNTSRAAAVQGFGEFLVLSGVPENVAHQIISQNPQLPIQAADWFAKSILAPVDKLTKSAQQAQPQQRQSSRRTASRSTSRFRTNVDLFDQEAEDAWAVNHGRL